MSTPETPLHSLTGTQQKTSPYSTWGVTEKYASNSRRNDLTIAGNIFKCTHQLFEEQVAKTPGNIALVYNDEEVTYQQLNSRANQLANFLRSRGVTEQMLIPICIERGIYMITGILGILKAGAAYVPMDPDFPAERLQYLLEDTKASVVLSSKHSSAKIPGSDIDIIVINGEAASGINDQPANNLQIGIAPTSLAYVIYTSGSTGKPKGVMIEQASLLNYLVNHKTKYVSDEKKGAGSFIHLSYTFDASLTALFMPLLAGKLVVVGSKHSLEIFEDTNLWKYAPFDFIKITPAHLDLLGATIQNKGSWLTNKLVVGGEALYPSHFDYFIERGVRVEVINEYGPTEATVGCSTFSFKIGAAVKNIKNGIPIGKPIDNTQMFILDDHLKLVDKGETGEIYIGGAGLARGYLNRPDLTSEKFIKNPFANDEDSRLYKTGDLGRWLPDGNMEYAGRKDDQVKIAGYRIELGEIESAVNALECISSSCVLVKQNREAIKKLVCYYVPNYRVLQACEKELYQSLFAEEGEDKQNDHERSAEKGVELQKHLKALLQQHLPEFMIPAEFIILTQLPLTNNGKIDRAALSKREVIKRVHKAPAPCTKTEKALTKIWQDILGLQNIDIHDNFFEIGGNSIQAARVFSRIRKTFGKQLPLAILLQAPTIEKLAAIITRNEKTFSWSSLVPLQPKGLKPTLYLLHAGAGNVVLYRELVQHLQTDQPVYALQAKGLNGRDTPHNCVEDMAAYYIREIRSIQPNGPYLLGGYCFGAIVAFEMAQQLLSEGQQIGLLASFNGISPVYNYKLHPVNNQTGINLPLPKGFVGKLAYHKKLFLALSTKEKLFYPIKRLIFKLQMEWFRVRIMAYNYYLRRNRPLPKLFAKHYYYDNNANMAKAYRPRPYAGKMTVFRSPEIFYDPNLGWGDFVLGGIDTFDIAGNHSDRRAIMNEPFVRQLAKELTTHIDKL